MLKKLKLGHRLRFNGPIHISFAVISALLFSSLLTYAYTQFKPTQLEQVKSKSLLRAVTINGPATYYQGKNGPSGFDYDLANEFAKYLQVELQVDIASSHDEALKRIVRLQSDFAATGTTNAAKSDRFLFTMSYMTVDEQIVKRQKRPSVNNISEIIGKQIGVASSTSLVESLEVQKLVYSDLEWTTFDNIDAEELLELVSTEQLDYALVNSNDILLTRHFFPELTAAFNLKENRGLSWVFRKSNDHSLYDEAQRFLLHIRDNGQLSELIERHYGHILEFNYSGAQIFNKLIETRLPRFKKLFQEAGERTGVDWRLLAAMSYQESHWNPRAKSPTGVRGLMMLTLRTAQQLGIKSRLDPEESINGGARYFASIYSRLNSTIKEPDRTWFAFAAYNLGLGHIRDARRLAILQNKNSDLWVEIKEILPLLAKRKWHKQTEYGYARGHEALQYVQNIRRYYDILVWKTSQEQEDWIDELFSIL